MSDYNEPSRLSREDAKLMAYMEARDLKAMKNLNKTPEEPRNYRSPEVDMMTDTPNKIASKWKKDMIFLAQGENISNNAIVDDLNFTPTKIKSDITQEMIDDYRAEQQNPLVLNGKSYAYHPASLDIELETFEPEEPAINPDEFGDWEAEIARLALEISRLEREITYLNTVRRRELDEEYNARKAGHAAAEKGRLEALQKRVAVFTELNIEEARKIAGSLSVSFKTGTKIGTLKKNIDSKITGQLTALSKGATHEEIERDYATDKRQLEERISKMKAQQETDDAAIRSIHTKLDQSVETIRQNRIREGEVAAANSERMKTLHDELEALNGEPFMEPRQYDESDEDYKARLLANGQKTLSDKQDEEQAKLANLEKCRTNLKGFLTDPSRISTVANKLSSDERQQFNKYIEPIKKKFLETFGFDKKIVSEEEIAQFIKEAVATKNFVVPSNSPGPVAPAVKEKAKPKAGSDFYSIRNYSKADLVELVDANGLKRGTKEFMYEQLLSRGLLSKKGDAALADIDLPEVPSHAPYLLPPAPLAAAEEDEEPVFGYGLGVHREKVPRHAPFGDYYVSPHNLHFKNVLSIRTRTKKPLNGFKDIRVSDTLAAIIMKILKGETVNKHDLALLNDNERMIYDNLIYMAKLHKTQPNTVESTVKKLKERLAVLEGELDAGNNNPTILKELHALVHKMAKHNIISHGSATAYWNDIKREYLL